MKLAFLAHPLRGDVFGNLISARRWYRFLTDHYEDTHFLVNWVIDCEVYDDAVEGQRRAGIRRNLELLKRCDAIFLVGGRVTPGMQEERMTAVRGGLTVHDLTDWGPTPPDCHCEGCSV